MSDTIACPGCGRTYQVPPKALTGNRMQVKCPSCGHRFALTDNRATGPAPPAPPPAQAGKKVTGERGGNEISPERGAEPKQLDDTPVVDPGGEPRREIDPALLERRAVRLSRALLTKMIQGQRERLQRARLEENLLLEFGEEIVKSWEIYLTKMGTQDDVVTSSFRDALNEILADGKKLF